MESIEFKTPTQKRSIPGQSKTPGSSSVPEAFTPIYDDSNLSAVICSKKKQYAELKAAQMMNEHYKKKIEKLKKNIMNLNKQKNELLPLLENKKNELMSANEYLQNIYQANPRTEYMKKQIEVLQNIQQTYTLKITDDKPFHDLGILKDNDSLSKLPKRISQLLHQVEKHKFSPFISSYSGVSFYDSKSMSESSLKRRYLVLKETTEGSIQKAILEKNRIKNEINKLNENIKKIKAHQYYHTTISIKIE